MCSRFSIAKLDHRQNKMKKALQVLAVIAELQTQVFSTIACPRYLTANKSIQSTAAQSKERRVVGSIQTSS
jgi:hypothetical protein